MHELADEGVLDEGLVRQVLPHLLLHEERVLELRSVEAGWEFNRNIFCLKSYLKNHLRFGLRFPTLIKSSKMGSLDMSQN